MGDSAFEFHIEFTMPKFLSKTVIITGVILMMGLISGCFFRACCVDFVDNYELAYRYDLRSGQLTHVNRTGYIVHAPIVVEVHTIDLRPMQVCINANSRVLNCKLVQFNPAGLDLFLSWHGRNNYYGPSNGNNSGTALEPILMSYAFDSSGKDYPFLTIIRELKNEEILPNLPPGNTSVK